MNEDDPHHGPDHAHDPSRPHGPGHSHGHAHAHGVADPSLVETAEGVRAVLWSLAILVVTAVTQLVIVLLSGSTALLADTIHNFGDALTALPLWVAFRLRHRPATRRFPYGLGRVEDLAGVLVVLIIFFSAAVAGWESVDHLLHPEPVRHLSIVAAAALVGFLGNEGVAIYRIRVGRRIGSAALVADGYHARVDGLTSLAVLLGAAGVWLGYPLADPIVGLLITAAILRIVWESAAAVFTRLLDGVEPGTLEDIRSAATGVDGVEEVTTVRARWLGHGLHAEVSVAVAPDLPVEEGHRIALRVRHRLLHEVDHLSDATLHVDPSTAPGEEHHRIPPHRHDGLPAHSH